jgi:uncharacterized protein YfaS (alpha-2-macroglobulin family)
MKRILGLILALTVAGAFLAYGITKEVPIGRLTGRVTMMENGRPLRDTLVTLTPSDEMHDDRPRRRFVTTDDSGQFAMQNVAAGDYDVEASAKEHHLSDRTITVVEGKPTTLEINMEPSERYLTLYTSQKVFAPQEKPSIEVHGFIQEDALHITVRKLSLDALAKRGGFDSTLSALSRPDENSAPINPNTLSQVVSQKSVHIRKKDEEGAFIQGLPLPKLAEGFYWVQCYAGAQRSSAFLNISRIALVTKSDGHMALSYVVDIKSGQPVPGATILASRHGHLTGQTKTDRDGLATVSLPKAADAHVVAARFQGSTALCSVFLRSDPGGETENEGDSGKTVDGRIFTYTDRPVYRPGDLVRFKSIVRISSGSEYRLPPAGPAKIEIRDSNEDLLETISAQLSKHGTLHGEFRTNPEAKPGVYAIVVKADGLIDHYYVNLAAYHKPDVKVTTTVEKKHYVIGDTVKVTLSCEYYFGGPVVGAKVTGYVYRSPDWSFQYGDDSYDPSLDDSPDDAGFQGGEYNEQVEAVTDATGRATIEFATKAKDDPDSFETDYRYDLSVNVQDGSDRSAEGTATVKASRGAFNLALTTNPTIAVKGETVDVALKATNYDAGKSPVAGKQIQLQIGEERWTDDEMVFIPQQTLNAVTGQTGEAHVKLPVGRAMSLHLKALAQDEAGRQVGAIGYVYVEGSEAERGPTQSTFTLKLNKPRFTLGDTATAMIETDHPGGVALLTLQAEHIISSQVVPLTSATTLVHFALPKETSPNAYVSVCYVREKQFHEDSKEVIVKRQDRHLGVQVTPDRPTAQPGEMVAFRVHTLDQLGHGVPAEISVGVVDESVYAIMPDETDIIKGLFPSRPNSIETEYSFPEIYLDGGDKAGGSVPIRTHFEDTASWTPEIETDKNGDGLVSLKLPDNLTTWRATAVGITDQSQAGMGTADIRSSKPIMVRVQSPAFMVKTDRQSISVAVTNDTGKDEDIHLRVDAQGVKLDAAPPADVRLAVGETQSIPVDVSAPASGAASLVARVWTDDGAKDGVESKFNVQPHGRLEVSNQSGTVGSEAKFTLTRDADADPTAGRLAVTLTPSVVSGMYQSLNGLVQFPYGCVEQTMSRFLPAVLVTRVLREQGMPHPELEKRVPAITSDGFARLAAMQHDDGGWGWWTYDASDAFMTAWVLDGLSRLKAVGVNPPPIINVKKAVEWAQQRLDTGPKDPVDSELYLMDALARYGKFKEDHSRRLILNSCYHGTGMGDNLRVWSLAAIAAHDAGESTSFAEILRHVDDGIDDGTKIYPGYDDYDDERSALALLALMTLNPDDARIGRLAAKLTSKRGVDGWESTRATTFAVEGLTQYLKLSKEGTGPVVVRVDLNGAPIRILKFDPSLIDAASLHIVVPVSGLKVGPNEISIHRQGPGMSFFAGELRQYHEQAVLGQVLDGNGLTIDRQYYKLAPQELEDGTMKLMKSTVPVDRLKAGDTIECVLTIRSKYNRQFLLIEDPIPSNCRVTQRVDAGDDEQWKWWWCDLTIFDDRVGFFATTMPNGTETISYTMRAEGPGVSHALPTVISNMYDPRQSGQSSETTLEVTQ